MVKNHKVNEKLVIKPLDSILVGNQCFTPILTQTACTAFLNQMSKKDMDIQRQQEKLKFQ